MPIDAGIYSQIKQPEAYNPLAEMAQFQQLQHLQTQNKLATLGFADRERALADAEAQRVAVKGFGSDAAANYARLLQTGNLTAAQGYLKGNAELGKIGADVGKTRAETTGKVFDTFRDMLGTVQTPEQAAQFLTASHADPTVGPILQRFGSLEQGLERIPRDPAGFAQWRAHTAIGIEKLSAQAKVQNVNLGGTMQTQVYQPATGQLTVAGAAPVTQDPNNIATNATSAANNAATNATHLQTAGMADERARETSSKPFEVTGPDGNPVLVQQDKSGNITPVTGYTPKGGTAKPLPGPVLKQLTEARDNAATIERLKTDFKPEFASKGVLGIGADASLSAGGITGGAVGAGKDAVEWWKNYRKQAELVERHALFGAALTPGEQQSWRSADIGPGMDAEVIARNLATRTALARRMFDNTRQDLIDAGHSDKRVNAIADRNAGSVGASGSWDAPPDKAAPAAPKPGDVQQGYVFTGGNPADKKSWRRQ